MSNAYINQAQNINAGAYIGESIRSPKTYTVIATISNDMKDIKLVSIDGTFLIVSSTHPTMMLTYGSHGPELIELSNKSFDK